jgi:hypothetical protein
MVGIAIFGCNHLAAVMGPQDGEQVIVLVYGTLK